MDDQTPLEIIATELPIVGAFVLVIGGVLWLSWTILGVLERALERHDQRKDDDGPD